VSAKLNNVNVKIWFICVTAQYRINISLFCFSLAQVGFGSSGVLSSFFFITRTLKKSIKHPNRKLRSMYRLENGMQFNALQWQSDVSCQFVRYSVLLLVTSVRVLVYAGKLDP
jgi:hypothetical protein